MRFLKSYVLPVVIGVVLGLAVLGVTAIIVPCKKCPNPVVAPAPVRVHDYNLLFQGDKLSFKGEAIRSTGMCIEVILAGRVDTIACGPVSVTETQETSGKPDAELPSFDPTRTKYNSSTMANLP